MNPEDFIGAGICLTAIVAVIVATVAALIIEARGDEE